VLNLQFFCESTHTSLQSCLHLPTGPPFWLSHQLPSSYKDTKVLDYGPPLWPLSNFMPSAKSLFTGTRLTTWTCVYGGQNSTGPTLINQTEKCTFFSEVFHDALTLLSRELGPHFDLYSPSCHHRRPTTKKPGLSTAPCESSQQNQSWLHLSLLYAKCILRPLTSTGGNSHAV
jgi:hypothetical protein